MFKAIVLVVLAFALEIGFLLQIAVPARPQEPAPATQTARGCPPALELGVDVARAAASTPTRC
jgi:hypothetical protein